MSEIHHNWNILNDMGVTTEAHISGAWLRVENLDKRIAIKIGHALVRQLDTLTDPSRHASLTLERVEAEAERRIEKNERVIFGELRPADRNCAVSVEADHNGGYVLKADIRNDFEDDPELNGGKRIQLQFIETIENIDFR